MDLLEDRLDRWVRAGLIDADQAVAIAEHESVPSEPERRVPLVAEALGYLGGALAVVAGVIAVEPFWQDFAPTARIALLTVIVLAVWSAGWSLRRSGEPAFERLASVLWFLSSAAVAVLSVVVAEDVLNLGQGGGPLVVGVTTAAWSALLWRRRRHSLQQLACLVGIAVAVVGGAQLWAGAPRYLPGAGLWLLGLAWGVLAHARLVPPRSTATALAATLLLVGSQTVVFAEPALGFALAFAAALALLAASILERALTYLAFGTVLVFLFVPQAAVRYFADTIGVPLALFVTGIALVGVALAVARLRPHLTDEDSRLTG